MNPYSAPGIGLDQSRVIELIKKEYDLKDDKWITSLSRKTTVKIARQLLMTCLIDHCGYTLKQAGEVCNRDHCTALHAKKIVLKTLWHDWQYGESVRYIYGRCIEIKKNLPR
jgi:chromosomal replication initiation ATPase DnaA